jgi:hypothetical protein
VHGHIVFEFATYTKDKREVLHSVGLIGGLQLRRVITASLSLGSTVIGLENQPDE